LHHRRHPKASLGDAKSKSGTVGRTENEKEEEGDRVMGRIKFADAEVAEINGNGKIADAEGSARTICMALLHWSSVDDIWSTCILYIVDMRGYFFKI
jgi:hypothetical protein